jgi:hypothetical protein
MTEINKLQYLQIGVQGENEATNIEIDMTAWAEEFPNAIFYILFKPYNSANPAVPVTTAYDSETKKLTWTVTSSVTQVVGVGYTEVRGIDGSVIKKSRIVPTSVENSVSGGVAVNPPEAYEDWYYSVLQKASDSEAYAVGKRSGSDVSSDDPAYHNNSLYYKDLAEDAKNASETAQDAAERAAEVALTQGGFIKMAIDEETGHLIFSYTEGVPVYEEDEEDE